MISSPVQRSKPTRDPWEVSSIVMHLEVQDLIFSFYHTMNHNGKPYHPKHFKKRLIKTLQQIFIGWKRDKRPSSSSLNAVRVLRATIGSDCLGESHKTPHTTSAPAPALHFTFSWRYLGIAQGRAGPQLASGTQFGQNYTIWETSGKGNGVTCLSMNCVLCPPMKGQALADFIYYCSISPRHLRDYFSQAISFGYCIAEIIKSMWKSNDLG